jgi:hypothetical protein
MRGFVLQYPIPFREKSPFCADKNLVRSSHHSVSQLVSSKNELVVVAVDVEGLKGA